MISVVDEDLDALIELAVDQTNRAQARGRDELGLGSFSRWGLDAVAGQFRFERDGVVEVVADTQVVGSFVSASQSWMWSWANQAIASNLSSEVARLAVFGDVRSIPVLTNPSMSEVDEEMAWQIASVTRHVLGYEMVYRAPMGARLVFFLLKNPRRTT